MAGYPQRITKQGLLELRDPTKRDHPNFRWGQAVVIKFFANSVFSGETERMALNLFYADDIKAQEIIEQIIKDYQL